MNAKRLALISLALGILTTSASAGASFSVETKNWLAFIGGAWHGERSLAAGIDTGAGRPEARGFDSRHAGAIIGQRKNRG